MEIVDTFSVDVATSENDHIQLIQTALISGTQSFEVCFRCHHEGVHGEGG